MKYKEDYYPIKWVDHVVDNEGKVIQQGTPVSQKQLNRMEAGIQTALGSTATLAVQNLQFIQKLTEEYEKMGKQKIKQGSVTVTEGNYAKVVLDGFVQYDAPNYQVLTEIIAGDLGLIGEIQVYDKISNGFKIKYTGSAKEAKINWTLINFDIK